MKNNNTSSLYLVGGILILSIIFAAFMKPGQLEHFRRTGGGGGRRRQ